MSRSGRKDKGIALILAIIVVTMVSLLLTSYVAMTVSERKRVEHEMAAGSAEYIARAGLERAFFDLSCEYEKDRSWINGGVSNTINGVPAVVPAIVVGTDRSNYQNFYPNPPIAFADGGYTVEIAFVNNVDDTAFLASRLWVRATGTVTATGDSVTLTQLARVRLVALVETDATTGDLLQTVRLYDTLDNPGDSLVDNPEAEHHFPADPNIEREIRISGAELDENVLIDALTAGDNLVIKGGYGYDFTDGSRDTSKNVSTLKDSGAAPVVTLSGAGTVIMGGVRIE